MISRISGKKIASIYCLSKIIVYTILPEKLDFLDGRDKGDTFYDIFILSWKEFLFLLPENMKHCVFPLFTDLFSCQS